MVEMNMFELAENNLSKNAVKNLREWLNNEKYKDFHDEIKQKIDNQDWQELEDAFCKDIEFGTSGRRGKVGAGPNRLNSITVGETAQALADYFSLERIKNPSVVIAWDVRNSSLDLAKSAAEVLAANDVKVYFFDDFRSTPELSFAIRDLNTSAGIMITASHNLPQDNGIKIYWNDGGQIISPHDKNLLAIAKQVSDFRREDFQDACRSGKVIAVSHDLDSRYHQKILAQSLSSSRRLKIAFSPLHGVGITNLLPVLEKAGFDVCVVEDQAFPDGNFTNIQNNNPNPESATAGEKIRHLMEVESTDIGLLTDPDGDRLGVFSREKDGSVRGFSGNQSAVLAVNYLLENLSLRGELKDGFICKSFVTTEAISALANKFNVEIFGDLPVGFKYIAEKIFEQKLAGKKFIAGFEESYGGLIGDYTRDKDAASFGLIIAEYASVLKEQNQTLGEKLDQIYNEVGWFDEHTTVINLSGGIINQPEKIIKNLVEGYNIFSEYQQTKQIIRMKNSTQGEKIDYSQVASLMIEFGNQNRTITIRQSGTESKLKIYLKWRFDNADFEQEKQQLITEIRKGIDECKTIN